MFGQVVGLAHGLLLLSSRLIPRLSPKNPFALLRRARLGSFRAQTAALICGFEKPRVQVIWRYQHRWRGPPAVYPASELRR